MNTAKTEAITTSRTGGMQWDMEGVGAEQFNPARIALRYPVGHLIPPFLDSRH